MIGSPETLDQFANHVSARRYRKVTGSKENYSTKKSEEKNSFHQKKEAVYLDFTKKFGWCSESIDQMERFIHWKSLKN